jgi:hypothetical protein
VWASCRPTRLSRKRHTSPQSVGVDDGLAGVGERFGDRADAIVVRVAILVADNVRVGDGEPETGMRVR